LKRCRKLVETPRISPITDGDLVEAARIDKPRSNVAPSTRRSGQAAVSMAAIRTSLKRELGADFGDVIYLSNAMVAGLRSFCERSSAQCLFG
jgi:hypothetical protein